MAAPSTIIRAGNGTSVVSYTLPAGLFQYIESVLVEVDNTAGGAIRPTLRVKSDAGQVIATKRQGESIPAGDTGTGTWALRLTDETPGSTPAATSDLLYDYTLPSAQRAIDTAVDGPMAGSLSQDYAVLEFYAVARDDAAGVGTGGVMQILVNGDATASHYAYEDLEWESSTTSGATGGPVNNQLWFVRIPGAASTAKYFNQVKGSLPAYADSVVRFRTAQFWGGDIQSGGPTGFLDFSRGVWKSAAAIDQITVRAGGSLDSLEAESRLIVVGVGKL